MGTINFTGGAPYELPVAQTATASAVDDTVQIRFEILLGAEHGSSPVPVLVRMTYPKARELAAQLMPSAIAAERRHLRR